MDLITPGLLVISLVIFAQSMFTLYLMLYSWEHPDRLRAAGGPERLRPARLGFTVLLPARHEEAVIGDTIRRVLKANYPAPMVEVIVICSSEDTGTIEVAQRTIETLGTRRARVVTFDGGPINKPHGLNVGFAASREDVVTIFDAEDDIDPDIFRIINTVMLDDGVGIVQAGVQLVNHRDHWFSLLNCLEYFFQFKSRLHFHARVGMIPLGGNTVFMRRELVARVGGWDEQCLTEDADIGVRLSALGERIRVVYDPKHVTREETPSSIAELVRQRTRWNQGFIQVLRKGDWLQIPGVLPKLLALYTFTFPIIQVPLTLLWPVAVIGGLWLKLPIVIAMATFLPLYAVGFQLLVNMIGAWMFAREFGFAMRPWTPLGLAFTFVPYQFALGLASARAMVRELHGNGSWEKTEHVGAHRRDGPTPRRTSWPTMRLSGHAAVAAGVVLAVILSLGLPSVGARPLVGSDPSASVRDR
ncbi:MAG: glycosyltransferase [Chloroflexota bacterium]|nr:glycosyltransferase [Chloroflexota bacterium]